MGSMNFRSFQLENQMRVLTVSDLRFVKSSCALAVMAGSMANPPEHLGLAHFLEHMLFLGTQEFPDVGEYENYLNQNGGGHNAYTSIDHTNYFFDVAHPAFEGALKRFSRFFVCPTFDENYVEREKQAVHSEHEKNRKDDLRREYRFQQLIIESDHPFSRFSTGDQNTLKKVHQKEVMDFYKKNYSSNLMCLVLMSNKTPEQLHDLAKSFFSDVLNRKIKIPQYKDPLFTPDQAGRFHCIASIRDQNILKISFSMVDDLPFWPSKPMKFLALLFGSQSEGSLLSFLKKEGLASNLEVSTWWRMFHIRVRLTEKGKQQWKEILKAVFSYIKLIREQGLKKHLFDERKALAEVNLQNMEPESSMERACDFSSTMLYYPTYDFLERHYLYHKYSPEDFRVFLKRLSPENTQVSLFSKQGSFENREPYYGIDYKTQDLDQQLLGELEQIRIHDRLKYPAPNSYIPTNLKLLSPKKQSSPVREFYKHSSVLYSQVDTQWGFPKGFLSLYFVSDSIQEDPRNYLLAKFYSRIKKEELNEWGYPAKLAGLGYQIFHEYNGIRLEVCGYSQHLCQLLKNLIVDTKQNRRLDEVKISERVFERLKEDYKKSLINKKEDPAYRHLLYNFKQLLSTASVHRDQYMDLVDSISLDEINEFSRRFFKKTGVRGFSYGNVDGGWIKEAVDLFYQDIGQSFFTVEQMEKLENQFIQIPNQASLIDMKGVNNNNGELTVYKISDWSIANEALLDVLVKLVEQPFFTELRTHQQLGYVVASFDSSDCGFCGLISLIQSQTHEAVDVFNRSRNFLKNFFPKMLDSLSDKDIETVKEALIQEASRWPDSLFGRWDRFYMMAETFCGDFQFFEKRVDALKMVDKKSLKSFVEPLVENLDLCPQMSLLYRGADSKKFEVPGHFKIIDDRDSFRKFCPKIQPYRSAVES